MESMANLAEHQSIGHRAFQDKLGLLAFHLAFFKKRKLFKRRRLLRTRHDFFSFGRRAFHLVQNEPEITGLLDLIDGIHPTIVCEIGTRTCGTGFLLSQAIPGVQTFIGLDLYVANWEKFKMFARPDQELHSIEGSSYSDEIVQRVKAILNGRQIDMLFIDGDHSYAGVKQDFLQYHSLVRDGGLIALHDIVQDHRTRFGSESPGYSGGVPTLWTKLKAAYPFHEFIENPEQDGFGVGAIRYSRDIPLPEL
jgi:predicted O-methyltransferase YrrM